MQKISKSILSSGNITEKNIDIQAGYHPLIHIKPILQRLMIAPLTFPLKGFSLTCDECRVIRS